MIDADTHFSEPWDLWTSRAPKDLKERVPQVRTIDGELQWTIDGDKRLASKCGHSAVMRDGTKAAGFSFYGRTVNEAHEGASQLQARLKVMDDQGIFAQVVYPNILGFGGQQGKDVDEVLRVASMQIFNDAMGEACGF